MCALSRAREQPLAPSNPRTALHLHAGFGKPMPARHADILLIALIRAAADLNSAQHLRLRAMVDQRQPMPVCGFAVPAPKDYIQPRLCGSDCLCVNQHRERLAWHHVDMITWCWHAGLCHTKPAQGNQSHRPPMVQKLCITKYSFSIEQYIAKQHPGCRVSTQSRVRRAPGLDLARALKMAQRVRPAPVAPLQDAHVQAHLGTVWAYLRAARFTTSSTDT